MIFSETKIAGAWLLDIEPVRDDRGFFARTWCRRELAAHGLDVEIAQESISHNTRLGTLRGLHFQRPPHEETKIVRCVRGAIYDVIVDLRPRSPTYLRWEGFNLTEYDHRALYIPKGCAHGFQIIADNADVLYRISNFYTPEAAAGYRYDEPTFGVFWPLPIGVISERDLLWPRYKIDD